MARYSGGGFACDIFLKVLETHGLRSWLLFPVLPLERLWRGLKEETHRQVRFWRWVGNFF